MDLRAIADATKTITMKFITQAQSDSLLQLAAPK
jgi:hypothetical protein